MLDYFVFPVNFNDIEEEELTHNHYRAFPIDLTRSDREILKQLKDIDKSIFENVSSITDSQNFDFLFGLIKTFGESIENKSMKVLEELSSTIRYIVEHVLKLLDELSEESDLSKLRVSFKMIIFLALYFISSTALKKAKPQTDILSDAINKEKGRKKTRNEAIQLTPFIQENQKNIIDAIKLTLNINFSALWEHKQVDSQFFKKYIDTCVKILQSTMAKDEQIIGSIFYILESILKSNNESAFMNFQTILANLVYDGTVTDNLVEFFSKAQGAELQKICTQALTLVVIYICNKQNLSTESQSIKNTKEFLCKLSERIPKTFYTNLSCFIILFKHQSYYLRNAIAEIMMNILKRVFCENQQMYKEAKEKFISTLLQRIHDKSSFSRCHILSILTTLSTERLIPRKYMLLFLKAGIDRVKDQSVNTRRKAIQLISQVIDILCQKEMLSLDEIEKELQICELELKTLQEQEEKLKREIDLVEEEDKLDELMTELKIIRKRIKATEEKEIDIYESKEINGLVQNIIANVRILLGSKNETDVVQTIRLFIKLHQLKFEKSKEMLSDIRVLIFSKEKKIKDQVLTTFIYLHLNYKSDEVARELVNLFTVAAPQDLSALQQLLETIISESISKGIVVIKPQTFAHLWNSFIQYERNQSNIDEKRSIMSILRIAFSNNSDLIKEENMESFLNILKSYITTNEPDFHILKEISRIISLDIQICAKYSKNILVPMVFILVNSQGTSNNEWFSSCENVLTCIFKVCESPEKLSESLIKKMHENLEKQKSVKSLTQFIFALSHFSLKCLIYLDQLENKIKGMKKKQFEQQNNEEEELDKVMGGVEAELEKKVEQIQMLSEKMLEDPFIGRWIKIIQQIVVEFRSGSELETISVLAFCKFMLLSSSFCQSKFPLVLKVLGNSHINSVVKNNIIIATGDLLHRFPNVIEPYNRHLYKHLHDEDPKVRKTTLTVITHLALNDMIKVKSDLCDVAILFSDSEPQIQSLVKQFFHEMNKKDPKTLFNLIPDALSRFSNLEKVNNESTFRIFLENILPLLEKDKYSESLIIKICERLSNSLNMLEICNTAYCLSEININEKGIRRILENFENFRKTLESAEVLQSFKNMITKMKKNQKNQFRNLIDELEEKVSNSNEQVFNAEQIKKRNLERLNKKNPKRKQTGTTNRRGRKKKEKGSEEEDSNEMQIEEQQPVVSRARPKRNNRKMRVIEENEEEQDNLHDEDFDI